jgi:hypothetical protein
VFSVQRSSDPEVWQSEELVERSLPGSLTIVYLSALGGNLKGLGRCYDPCVLVRQIEEVSCAMCYTFHHQRVSSGLDSISDGISVCLNRSPVSAGQGACSSPTAVRQHGRFEVCRAIEHETRPRDLWTGS